MTKSIFMEKYPVFSLEIKKEETSYKSVNEIIDYLKSLVENHPIAVFITTFDHYAHTSAIEDNVLLDGLQEAKNLIFCFGKRVPSTKVLAVRPRSISVSQVNDSFMIDFLEVPNKQLQTLVEEWVNSLL